jgi:5-formyltetrahydrofolate cyclo-ligase
MNKSDYRHHFIAQRNAISTDDHHLYSQKICTRLQTWLDTHNPKTLGAFYPTQHEPNILPVLQEYAKKNTLYLPTWNGHKTPQGKASEKKWGCRKTPQARPSEKKYRSLLSVNEDIFSRMKRRMGCFATVPNYKWCPYKPPLKLSKFGILEPPLQNQIAPSKLDACLVPAIAVDKCGHRIGWGHGFFDQLLSDTIPHRIGIIFSDQLCSKTLPQDNWDVTLTDVITNK